MRGEQGRRGDEAPREHRARIEELQGLRRPAEQDEQRDDHRPAGGNVARELAGACAVTGESSGKGHREDEQGDDQAGGVEAAAERRDRCRQGGGCHQRIERRAHQLARSGLAAQQRRGSPARVFACGLQDHRRLGHSGSTMMLRGIPRASLIGLAFSAWARRMDVGSNDYSRPLCH
jgi:hypothetical protein